MEEQLKQRVRKTMESIKDEIQSTGGKQVKDITYCEKIEIAGIQMNLYYAVSKDREGNSNYEVFNTKGKIGEGNKSRKSDKNGCRIYERNGTKNEGYESRVFFR